MLDRSRGREIPGRPSLPRPLPKPERQLNPRSRRMRDGRRCEVDPCRDRPELPAASRTVPGRRGRLPQRLLPGSGRSPLRRPPLRRPKGRQPVDPRGSPSRNTTVRGPKGNSYKVLTATPAGAELARRQAVGQGLDPGQRTWAGLVKPGELSRRHRGVPSGPRGR